MKRLLTMAAATLILLAGVCQASIESKNWPASDKAKAFVNLHRMDDGWYLAGRH